MLSSFCYTHISSFHLLQRIVIPLHHFSLVARLHESDFAGSQCDRDVCDVRTTTPITALFTRPFTNCYMYLCPRLRALLRHGRRALERSGVVELVAGVRTLVVVPCLSTRESLLANPSVSEEVSSDESRDDHEDGDGGTDESGCDGSDVATRRGTGSRNCGEVGGLTTGVGVRASVVGAVVEGGLVVGDREDGHCEGTAGQLEFKIELLPPTRQIARGQQ